MTAPRSYSAAYKNELERDYLIARAIQSTCSTLTAIGDKGIQDLSTDLEFIAAGSAVLASTPFTGPGMIVGLTLGSSLLTIGIDGLIQHSETLSKNLLGLGGNSANASLGKTMGDRYLPNSQSPSSNYVAGKAKDSSLKNLAEEFGRGMKKWDVGIPGFDECKAAEADIDKMVDDTKREIEQIERATDERRKEAPAIREPTQFDNNQFQGPVKMPGLGKSNSNDGGVGPREHFGGGGTTHAGPDTTHSGDVC